MAFQMKDSPHKRGEIQGTESALKVKSWIIKQVAKNAPKVINKIDDAWVATRDAIFGGGKKTVKNVSTKTKNVKKSEFIGKPHYLDDSPKVIDFFTDAKTKNSSGFFGLYKNPKTGKMAFDPTKRMVGSPEDIGNIDNIIKYQNKNKWK